MSFNHSVVFATGLIALAANACATREALPAAPLADVACQGGSIRGAADAVSYSQCNFVEGDLTVSSRDLDDLTALSHLRRVTGTLRISDSPELDDLSGLENLSSVGALELSDNVGLTSLSGLEGLSFAGRVVLHHNGIYNAAGLSALHEVGDLVVTENRRLNSLNGLQGLKRAGSVDIRKNPVLCGMRLLPGLERVSTVVLRDNRGISQREAHALLDRTGQSAGLAFAMPGALQQLAAAR
jgi:Receptor L domain